MKKAIGKAIATDANVTDAAIASVRSTMSRLPASKIFA